MTRNIALIENITKRKISFKKRHKTFLKKASELNTFCDAELAIIINSPYHDEPKIFPNHDDAINTIEKFRDFPAKSKIVMTQEELIKQRIKKIEEQLQKVRKKNRIEEFTNKMYEVLNKKDIPTDMHPYDLSELSNVVNQNLKQVHEAIKMKVDIEGSTSNTPQPIAGMMIPIKTSFEGPKAPLSTLVGGPVSMVPLVAPSIVPSGTNLEGYKNPLLVPNVAPISMVPPMAPSMVSSVALAPLPQSMFHPLMTFSQTVPLVDRSWGCPSSHPPLSFSSEVFPPMAPQMYSSIPLQTDLRWSPELAPSIPPIITMTSSMSSSMMAPPMFPLMTSQVEPLISIPPMDALMPMNNNQDYFVGISPMLDWSIDDIMTLCDDLPFNNDNIQDPNNINIM